MDSTAVHPARQWPLVTVVIPSHNYARYVGDAVQSVLAQTYAPVEIIVVDDGSTDDTFQVLARFGDRIRVLRLPGLGVAHARNAGLRAAMGEFVVFLDADDVLLPDALTAQVACLERCPDVDVVHGQWYSCNQRTGVVRLVAKPEITGDALAYMALGNVGAIDAIMIRRRALDEVGGFDSAISYTADWEMWFRLALHGYRFGYVSQPVAVYRVHGSGMQTRIDVADRDVMYVLGKFFGDPVFKPLLSHRRRHAHYTWRRYLGGMHLLFGDDAGALPHFREMVREMPGVLREPALHFRIARIMWRAQVRLGGTDPERVVERALQFAPQIDTTADGRRVETAAAHVGVALVMTVAGHRRRALELVAAAFRLSARTVLSRFGLRLMLRIAMPAGFARRVLDHPRRRTGETSQDLPSLVRQMLAPSQASSSGGWAHDTRVARHR